MLQEQRNEIEMNTEQRKQIENEIMIILKKITKRIATIPKYIKIEEEFIKAFSIKYGKLLTYAHINNNEEIKEKAKSFLLAFNTFKKITTITNFFYRIETFLIEIKNPNIIEEFINNLFNKNKYSDFKILFNLFKKNQIATILLENGLNPNLKDKLDSTILIYLAKSNSYEGIKLLFNYNVDINWTNKNKNSALMLAAQFGHHEVVKTLLQHNANANQINATQDNALMLAAEFGHHEIVTTLIQYDTNVNQINITKDSALTLAAGSGYHEVVNILIKAKANIEHANENKNTALVIAAANSHHKIVKLLLKNNAKVEIRTLIAAINSKSYKIIKTIIENDSDNNQIQENKNIFLMLAIKFNHPKIVKMLIEQGANVNYIDSELLTPLLNASYLKHDKITKILLDSAQIKQTLDYHYFTLIMFATTWEEQVIKTDATKEQIKQTLDDYTALMFTIKSKNYQLIETFCKVGSNVNLININGITPYIIALKYKDQKIIDILNHYGADINYFNEEGLSCLIKTIINNNDEQVSFLLKNGANPDLENKDGLTARDFAKLSTNQKIKKILIIEDQIKTNLPNTTLNIELENSNSNKKDFVFSATLTSENYLSKTTYQKSLTKRKKITIKNWKKTNLSEFKKIESNSAKKLDEQKPPIVNKIKTKKSQNIQQPEISKIELAIKYYQESIQKAKQYEIEKKLKQEQKLKEQKLLQQNKSSNLEDAKNIHKQIEILKLMRNKVAEKINPNIYKIKRNTELDHEDGRPGIIIAKQNEKTLVYLGFSTKKENSLTIRLEEKETFFNQMVWINDKVTLNKWQSNFSLSQKQKIEASNNITIENLKKILLVDSELKEL